MVKLPNGATLQNTHECYLNIPQLAPSARLARIFPGIQNSLLSLGQLCDGGCEIFLDKNTVQIKLNEKVIMTGNRNHNNKLWEVNLDKTSNAQSPEPNQLNNVFKISSIQSSINYLHAACFYPTKTTWIKAINAGFFASWPKLTADAVKKHLNPSPISSRGRIQQTPKNLRSTKNANRIAIPSSPIVDDHATINKTDDFPEQIYAQDISEKTMIHEKCNEVFIKIKTIYSDQTGPFPVPSSRGYKYLMVFYDVDSNAILARPIKTKKITRTQRNGNPHHPATYPKRIQTKILHFGQ